MNMYICISAGDLVPETPDSNPAFSRGGQLAFCRFDITSLLPVHQNYHQEICILPEPGVKPCRQWGRVDRMLADHWGGLLSPSLIFDCSVGLSAGIQSAEYLVSETLGSTSAFSRGRQLISFDSI